MGGYIDLIGLCQLFLDHRKERPGESGERHPGEGGSRWDSHDV